jgi:hypothetical protein
MWPLPNGPPNASYDGNVVDPKGALLRVDTEAKFVAFARTRPKNLEQVSLDSPKDPQFETRKVPFSQRHASDEDELKGDQAFLAHSWHVLRNVAPKVAE